jgi:hypothetical protein
MTVTTVAGTLTEAEHRAQLRRALVASTVGTTIEWYDFLALRHGQRARFRANLFPAVRPLDGGSPILRSLFYWLCRAAHRRGDLWPLGRSHRAQGNPDRNLAADRVCHHRGRSRSDLREHRHVGRGASDRAPPDPGHRGGWRMGRLRAAGDGMGANEQESRLRLGVAAIRRALRPVSRKLCGARLQLPCR